MVHTLVRQLKEHDKEAVINLVHHYLRELVARNGIIPNEEKILGLINATVSAEHTNSFAVGVFVDGTLVGILGYVIADRNWWSTEKAAYDTILYCKQGYRGYGFTKRMLSEAQVVLEGTDAQVQYLGSASKIDTERTLKLYEHLGFKLMGFITEKEI